MSIPTTAISIGLLGYLRALYQLALEEFVCGKDYSGGINGHTEHAIPAYITAVTAVETFTNEMLLGPVGQSFQGPKAQGFWDALENTRLPDKLLFAPEFHFGKTFATNAPPYQDMHLLIRLRNSLVHYKMDFDIPKPVKDLKQRGIALGASDSPWTSCVSTTEGMRWAHKTACETIKEIIGFANQESHPVLVQYGHLCARLLETITETTAVRFIEQLLASKDKSECFPKKTRGALER
jgi:hypothetical protein